MRIRVVDSAVVLVVALAAAFSWVALGKTAPVPNGSGNPQIQIIPATPNPNQGRAGAVRKPPPPGPPHDAHDLNGVWTPAGNFGPPAGEVVADPSVSTGWMRGPLPLTAAGKVALESHKGGKGPRGGRSYAPSVANDPIGDANPPGLVRTFVYGRSVQFLQMPDEVVNLFEWYHFWRQVWTDGRKLPDDPDLFWYGTSVGKWDGDHFIVNTVGLDDRNWLDMAGAPESDALKVNEDWHRMDRDNMEFVITFDDPKFYTHPWSGDKRIWRLQAKGTPGATIFEDIFAPWDEQDFNKRIRDPNPIINGGKQ
jgi:hypothetical protein